MSAAEIYPMDDGFQAAAELNALREQEARQDWALIKGVVEVSVRTGLIHSPAAICALRRALTTCEHELGFSPRNH